MTLCYLLVNAAWAFVFGDDASTASVIALDGEDRFFTTRKAAVEAAARRGLAVDSKGRVS